MYIKDDGPGGDSRDKDVKGIAFCHCCRSVRVPYRLFLYFVVSLNCIVAGPFMKREAHKNDISVCACREEELKNQFVNEVKSLRRMELLGNGTY